MLIIQFSDGVLSDILQILLEVDEDIIVIGELVGLCGAGSISREFITVENFFLLYYDENREN